MAKIVSRVQEEDKSIAKLKEVVLAASDGKFNTSESLEELVKDVDVLLAAYGVVTKQLQRALVDKEMEVSVLSDENRIMLTVIENLKQEKVDLLDVTYDENMDHVVQEFMETVIGSGAAEPTFDGEISFLENIALGKEDFKPMVRRAIVNWLELRLLG